MKTDKLIEEKVKELGMVKAQDGIISKSLLKKALQEVALASREDTLNELAEEGHGGGNWRRLIIQKLSS